MNKRTLSYTEIWNMSFGFLGIQMGFALQNANASRILQTFGSDLYSLSWFWIVAPLMGLIVQPIVGYYSDKTWTKLGRRKPYLLAGGLLAAISLILMPQANLFTHFLPAIWIGAGMLILMNASFNISMEPFRALVGDNLNSHQKTLGFSVQTALIGIGAVIGSWLPYILENWLEINTITSSGFPKSLILSFNIGAVVLILSVLITIATTKEYNPKEIKSFSDNSALTNEKSSFGLKYLFLELKHMPKIMKQLSGVQFFSWFGLFSMWVFSTPAIAQHIFQTNNIHSKLYNEAANWVGIIFGVYNMTAVLIAFLLTPIAKKIGRKKLHSICLLIGGLGLISMYFATDKYFLIGSMVAVGIAWASILSMPYAMLSDAINPQKMGISLGLFNFFIVIPQIINAFVSGPFIKYICHNQAIYALVISGVSIIVAAVLTLFVKDATLKQQ